MRKINYLRTLSLVFILFAGFAVTAQTTAWADSSSGLGDHEYGTGVSVDTEGNIIAVGYFEGQSTFGETLLVSAGNSIDIIVQKFDAEGNRLWMKTFAGFSEDYAHAVVTDSQNNIYVSGRFLGSLWVDQFLISSAFNPKFHLIKLNPEGDVVWSQAIPGSNLTPPNLAIDSNDVIYMSGSFADEQQFGSFTLDAGEGSVFFGKNK